MAFNMGKNEIGAMTENEQSIYISSDLKYLDFGMMKLMVI